MAHICTHTCIPAYAQADMNTYIGTCMLPAIRHFGHMGCSEWLTFVGQSCTDFRTAGRSRGRPASEGSQRPRTVADLERLAKAQDEPWLSLVVF